MISELNNVLITQHIIPRLIYSWLYNTVTYLLLLSLFMTFETVKYMKAQILEHF